MRKILFIIFIFRSFLSFSQHEADYWYFGNYAGLDFSSGKPEPLTDGQLKNYEGCAVISDSTGNLLFYTNGVTVWNKEHLIMENGTGLFGDTSSTQSAIIIPQPGNDSLFYLFTTDELSVNTKKLFTDGLNYSIVNINKNNGNGKIVYKNIHLLDSATEKLTAVRHQNKNDIWIITHEWGNSKYYAWLLTKNGLNTTPVISDIGTPIGNDQRLSIGYMKTSPNGTKIVTAILGLSKWEIFDFDTSTGLLSNKIEISLPGLYLAYACEFSPDASKLYICSADSLLQADMNAGNENDIQNSLTKIAKFNSPAGAIQNANNGKLYITSDLSDSLAVINFPDSLPDKCGFVKNAVYLDGRKARLGLPNFMQSYFHKVKFRAKNTCFNDSSIFSINNSADIDSAIWNFDDPDSGTENISKKINPKHLFSHFGIFRVKLTVWFNNISAIYFQNIKIVAPPSLFIGKDTVLCGVNSLVLSAYSPHYTYLWSTSSTDSVINVNIDGTYWVNIENFYTGCKNSDTVDIIFSEIPEINLGNDKSFCENHTFIINAYHSDYTYTWQDNSHNSYFETDTAGTFIVEVKNSDSCQNSDTINLKKIYIPRFDLGKDTVVCEGHYLTLKTNLNNIDFIWQDGSTDSVFYADKTGMYSLTTKNICGSWSDSVFVTAEYCGPIEIPNVFTPNEDGINDSFKIKGIENDIWSLTIYSRWGDEVYYSPDYQSNWKAKNINNGIYYYILSKPERNQTYKGTVRVIK
ncbi:MAG: gliding motility-associated C-terminal domain-containing protein [Bacteroidales bacterium]|nr:gliding motility-associated C-terminal domain-containing protein [Bacteroidales bacterium]